MALTVALTGTSNIDQGQQTTITATVTDDGGQAVQGAEVTFTASRGTIPGTAVTTDANGMASAVYRADFTDANDVIVTITGSASFTDTSPTITTASLTAMNELGITGQIVNMYISDTGNNDFNNNTVIYATSDSDTALAAGSDDDVSSSIRIWRVMWNASGNTLILNNDGSGDIDAYFRSNTSQSVYLVFNDGTYHEVTNARYDAGGSTWARWALTDTDTISKMDNLGADTTLLVGVGTVGTIGLPAETGSDTFSVTAANVPFISVSLEAIDEQFINVGTTDYELAVEVYNGSENTTFDVDGSWEGFYYDWVHDDPHDSGSGTGVLYIRSEKVTRIIGDAEWQITATEGIGTGETTIIYNVVPNAPVIEDVGTLRIYRDLPLGREVTVSNNPSSVLVDGDQVAMKFEGGEAGVNLLGTLPMQNANLTKDAFMATVDASNDGGEHTRDITIEVTDPYDPLFILATDTAHLTDTLYVIQNNLLVNSINLAYDIDTTLVPSSDRGVFVFRESEDLVAKVDASPTILWTDSTSLPSANYDTLVASSDGGVFAFNESNDNVYKFSATGSLLWTYTGLPTQSYQTMQATSDGGVILYESDTQPRIWKISSAGSQSFQYTSLPTASGFYNIVTSPDGGVFAFNRTTRAIYKIDASGSLSWTYTGVPSSSELYAPIFASSDDGVFVFNEGGTLYKISSTGSLAWQNTGFGASQIIRPIASSDGGALIVIYGTARKITGGGSSLDWSLPGVSGAFRASSDGGLYAGGASSIQKIDADGNREWEYTELPDGTYQPIAVYNPIF